MLKQSVTATPMASSIRPRGLSRRDHVLNLLPPLTVLNKEDATLHDRLFSDDPPAKNYPKNFPSKVLRHLGEWTFYSAPTKGELALLDKNMYDLENDMENPNKNDANEKNTEHEKHTPGTQSQYAGDDKKTLETRKGMTLKTKRRKQKQQTKQGEKIFKEEVNDVVEHQKAGLPPETTQGKSSKANSLGKTKQVGGKKGNNIEGSKSTEKKVQRPSYVTCASKKLKKNAQVKSLKSQPSLANVEITLKKSRGKVLGGAESGDEISTEPLTVEGHNMSVPGSDRKYGHTKEPTRDIERAGAHKESVKLKLTKRKDSKVKRRNRSFISDKETADLDTNDDKTVVPEKALLANPKRSVIKIPLQEIDCLEEIDDNNRTMTPEPEVELDIKSENIDSTSELQTKVHSPSEEQSENVMKSRASPENLCGSLDMDVLRDKRVKFGPSSEKEAENDNKSAKSQNGRKKERKRSGKNRVRSG